MITMLAAISAGKGVLFIFVAVAGLFTGLAIRRALENRRTGRK